MKRLAVYALTTVSLAAVIWLFSFGYTRLNRAVSSAPPQQFEPPPVTPSNDPKTAAATRPAGTGRPAARLQTKSTGNAAAVSGQPAAPLAAAAQTDPSRKRPWDQEFLAGLQNAAEGSPLRFELVEGQWAEGTIRHTERRNGELIYVAGQLTGPEAGRFFFQKQLQPGVAGDFVGMVEFPGSKQAYRLEPTGPGGAPELVERPLGNVICLRLPPPAATTNEVEQIPPLNPGDFPNVPIPDYQNGIIVLESLPGSTPVIYLDFQGGYTPTWGGIAYDRPNVNNAQIRDVWKRVAEDYLPFNINITTDLKVYQRAPEISRQRVVITPTTTAAPGAGGVAYIGSFNWAGDTPCWVFITSGKNCAEACSHEAGHAVGLSHDGQDVNGNHTEYYGGQGTGDTGWAPIMGVGYYQNVTEWCQGEYANANNTQDQLAMITSQNNNVSYRADDTGANLATSRYLELYADYTAHAEGVIERTADTDAFQFTTDGGAVSLRADPVNASPNLAILVTLADASDSIIASNNPQTTLWAAITTNLPAGTYTFRVTGAGRNNPLTDGFSSYASLGYYSITGTVASARLPNRFAIPENTPNGTLVGVVPATNPNGDPLLYIITSGNTGNTFAIDNFGSLSVASNSLLDYEALARNTQLPVQFELFVNISNTINAAFTETNRRVVVAVTDVNEAPSLPGLSISVLEHTQPGTVIGTIGSDPDFYTLLSYSILGGNSNGMFTIGSQSGAIIVVGDLNTATQRVYSLTVMASDQTPPTPLTATSTVTVTVLTNNTSYRPGTLSYTVYTNITGNLISALTSAPSYPDDPALEKQVTLFEGDRNRGTDYGAVMRGYLIPPATGYYTFWIATDDNGELWLSTSTNTASISRIAYISGNNYYASPRQWNKYSSQQSAPVSLVGGRAYYVEARLKQGSVADNIAVAWQCTTAGIAQDVVPGKYLAPYFINYKPRALGFTYNLHRDAIFGSRLGTVGVTDVNSNDSHSFILTSNSLFSIDALTGVLRLTNETALQTTSQTNYILQVRATDTGSPPRSGITTVTVNIVATNVITTPSPQQEMWTNIGSGNAVSVLTNQSTYPKRPNALRRLTAFDSGQNLGDNYGSRIRAYLTPANSGVYTFFLASDDNSQLKFSASTNPATASQIAAVNDYTDYQQWTKFATQQSAPISLVAGQRYYLETLHKEGSGGDHVEVAWTGPGLAGTNSIGGSFLTPVDLNYPPDLGNRTIQFSLTATNGTLITNLTALDSPLDTLTYKLLSGNLSNTFALNPDTGALSLTNNTLIATYLVSTFSLGVQVQDSGYGGLYPLRSAQSTVTVQVADNALPILWTGNGTNANWSTSSNWNGALLTDNSKLRFAGINRLTNYNDLLTRVGNVAIGNGFYISGNPLLLLAGIYNSGNSTWAINSTLNQPETFTNAFGTLSIAGTVTNNGNLLTLLVNSAMNLNGVVSGAGGLAKSGPGTLTITSANAYTGPTVIGAGTLVLNGAGAIANSASIDLQAGAVLNVGAVTGGFTVPAVQLLKGNGAVVGNATINGTLWPGASIGLLTFSNNLGLAGNTLFELSKTGSILTNDVLRVVGALNCGGALLVTNLGGPLASDDRFTLMSATSFGGAFTSLSLPPLGPGLIWDTSQLTINGTIRVATLGPPQILPVVLQGTNLVLQVQSSINLHYVLEATSSLETPVIWTSLSTNAGTGGLLILTAPVEKRLPRQFFQFWAY